MSLSDSQKNADKTNRLIDAYIDADDGKICEFNVRTELSWEEIDPDAIGEGKTGVTVGFYEGINELFLKVSK